MTIQESRVELNQPVKVTIQITLRESCNIMKRLSLVAVGVGCMLFQAHATLLFSDNFNYTPGTTLGGQVNPGSGYTWGPGEAANLSIGSGNLTYFGLQDLGGNELSVTWGAASSDTNGFATVSSGSIYYSFLLDVTTTPSANSYLTSLNPSTTTPGGGTDALSVYFGTAASGYRLGLRTGSDSTSYATGLTLDTTYLVVVQFNFSANQASLYLDPASATFGGATPPTPTLTGTPVNAVTSIDNVGFKSQSSGSTAFDIGNVLIGTDWADVTPVPEPVTFALAGLGVLGLVIARRMRR